MVRSLLVLLAGCSGSDPAGPPGGTDPTTPPASPTEPVAEITSPSEGAVFRVSEAIPLTGRVTDGDDGPEELAAWWESSQDGDLPVEVTLGSDGGTHAEGQLTIGTHQLVLWVRDPEGRVGSDRVVITVLPDNTPPTVAFDAPEPGEILPLGPVTLSATVADGETAPQDLELSWVSDTVGVLGEVGADGTGRATMVVDVFGPGLHQVTLTARDGGGLVGLDSVVFYLDAPPRTDTATDTGTPPTDTGTPW